jgi:hypothetical protein
MQGIFYLLAIIAVAIVFYWFMRNDRIAEGKQTHGLLAYKESGPDKPTGKKKKRKKGRP